MAIPKRLRYETRWRYQHDTNPVGVLSSRCAL